MDVCIPRLKIHESMTGQESAQRVCHVWHAHNEVVHPPVFSFLFLALGGGPHDCHLLPLKRRWLWERSDPSVEVPSDCNTSTLRIDRHQLAVKDVAESVQLPNSRIRSWFCALLNFCFTYWPDCLLWKFLTIIMLRVHGIIFWQIFIQLRLPFQTGAIKILEISPVLFFVVQHGSDRGWMNLVLFCYMTFFSFFFFFFFFFPLLETFQLRQ